MNHNTSGDKNLIIGGDVVNSVVIAGDNNTVRQEITTVLPEIKQKDRKQNSRHDKTSFTTTDLIRNDNHLIIGNNNLAIRYSGFISRRRQKTSLLDDDSELEVAISEWKRYNTKVWGMKLVNS